MKDGWTDVFVSNIGYIFALVILSTMPYKKGFKILDNSIITAKIGSKLMFDLLGHIVTFYMSFTFWVRQAYEIPPSEQLKLVR